MSFPSCFCQTLETWCGYGYDQGCEQICPSSLHFDLLTLNRWVFPRAPHSCGLSPAPLVAATASGHRPGWLSVKTHWMPWVPWWHIQIALVYGSSYPPILGGFHWVSKYGSILGVLLKHPFSIITIGLSTIKPSILGISMDFPLLWKPTHDDIHRFYQVLPNP